MNVDGCRRVESGVKKRYESCLRPLHLFLVTEKKKKICVEGVKKNRPQTEKTAAFKAAGSDQFYIGPCTTSLRADFCTAVTNDKAQDPQNRLLEGTSSPLSDPFQAGFRRL